MKLPKVLAVLIGIAVLACSTAVPAPAEPTPNIEATVEGRAKELVATQPTATPYPTYTPVPTATTPHIPTDTPSASKSPAVGGEHHTNRRVGNKIGDISPDFSILLTTGETLYSSTIRSDRMPVFLFFFTPL